MGSSYYITYGGNRLTFPGATGSVVWEAPNATVFLDPGRTSNLDYLKMRFVTPDGGEIIMEDGSGTTASASAIVPVNSTAYWTANGYQENASARYHVSALVTTGFSGVSAYTSVNTSFYINPDVTSYGSAVLVSTGSASAATRTMTSRKAVFGQGSTSWNTKVSASSFIGNYDPGYGTASQRVLWIPHGAKITYAASSIPTRTFSFSTALTSMSGYGISYNHKNAGTTGYITGYMDSARGFYLTNGRMKSVYGTGTGYQLATVSAKSASVWRAYTILTGFSSNLSTGSSLDTYLEGSANAGNVNGFSARKEQGQMRNSAGTWIVISGTPDIYVWKFVQTFTSMSASMSGSYSAVRAKGGTGNTTATATIYGYHTASGSYSMKQGTFAYPTASAKTSTNVQTVSTSRTGNSSDIISVANMFQCQGPNNANMWVNCRGAWTASGVVL